jgi:hypothetical protein
MKIFKRFKHFISKENIKRLLNKTYKGIADFINKEKTLLTILGVLILFGAFLWIYTSEYKDFGLNFFTEMLGVLVTILVVERIFRNREKNHLLPQKISAYEDVRLFTTLYINFWVETYRISVPKDDPENLQKFFSQEGMGLIGAYLDMDSEPNVTPNRKWWDWMTYNVKEFQNAGDKILDRHAIILEPELYSQIHQLTESSFNKVICHMPAIRQSDTRNNFQRNTAFGSYSIPPINEDFEAILYLHNWCEKQYEEYRKIKPNIHRVTVYEPKTDKNLPLKCTVLDEV